MAALTFINVLCFMILVMKINELKDEIKSTRNAIHAVNGEKDEIKSTRNAIHAVNGEKVKHLKLVEEEQQETQLSLFDQAPE